MNIEAFLLCEAATVQKGNLNILGAFEAIWAKKLPAKHPAFSVALRIRFEKSEEGDHPIKIQIINQDGQVIGSKLEAKLSVKVKPGFESAVATEVLNYQNFEFEKFGKYRIDMVIDGQIQSSLPLFVIESDETGQK